MNFLFKEKSLMIFLDDITNTYVGVRKFIGENCRKRHRAEISLDKRGDLILAGQNFILLRYVVIIGFYGDFKAWTLDMDGDFLFDVYTKMLIFLLFQGHICLSHYHVEFPQPMYLNKKRCDVIRITRIIRQSTNNSVNSENVHEIYHYLPTGHLIKYESCFSEFMWHINPLHTRFPTQISHQTKKTIESQYKDDVELLTMFLDKKNDLQRKYQHEVLYKRPAIKSIIRDYVLCLVHNKPEHVLDFTLEYFMTLNRQAKKTTDKKGQIHE